MQWYYSKNSTQLGPVPDAELRAKLASGEVAGTDMVWKDGMTDWLPVSSVGELHDALARRIVTPQHVVGSPYAPPSAPTGWVAPAPTSGLAIASLICGIVGLFACFVPGIAAVICGHLALSRMADPNARLTGKGMAIAGLVLGYLSLLLLVGTIVVAFFAPSIGPH